MLIVNFVHILYIVDEYVLAQCTAILGGNVWHIKIFSACVKVCVYSPIVIKERKNSS